MRRQADYHFFCGFVCLNACLCVCVRQSHDDFAFFDYAPMAFLVLRSLVGISPMAYMLSLTKEAVRAPSNRLACALTQCVAHENDRAAAAQRRWAGRSGRCAAGRGGRGDAPTRQCLFARIRARRKAARAWPNACHATVTGTRQAGDKLEVGLVVLLLARLLVPRQGAPIAWPWPWRGRGTGPNDLSAVCRAH